MAWSWPRRAETLMGDLAAAIDDPLNGYMIPGFRNRSLYEYDSLDDPEGDIRLCTILPHYADEEQEVLLRLKIASYSLTAVKDRYDAVSYPWGEDGQFHKVLVNDQYVFLRDNIYQFLLHCRDTALRHNQWLWIDSICINQRDSREKNHQVRFMKEIFSKAHTVLIWLPDASARDGISKMAQTHGFGDEPSISMWERLFSVDTRRQNPAIERELGLLMLSVYWRRLWILQEVVVAQRPMIVSGVHRIDFFALVHLEFFINWADDVRNAEKIPMSDPQKQCIMSMEVIKRYRGEKKPVLFGLLEGAGMNFCADVRDRIYGVLGIARDCRMIRVDYTADTEQLLCQVLDQVQLENNGAIKLYHVKLVLSALGLDYERLYTYCATCSSDKADRLRDKRYQFWITAQNAYSNLRGPDNGERQTFPQVRLGESSDSAKIMRRHSTMLKPIAQLQDENTILCIDYDLGRIDYFLQVQRSEPEPGGKQEYSIVLVSAVQAKMDTTVDSDGEYDEPVPVLITRPFSEDENSGFAVTDGAGLASRGVGVYAISLKCSALFLALLVALPSESQLEDSIRHDHALLIRDYRGGGPRLEWFL